MELVDTSIINEKGNIEYSSRKFLEDALINFRAHVDPKRITKTRISKQKQISKLTDSYNKEQLVLVLGAGVSIDYGLPNWNTLLQKLLINTITLDLGEEQKEKSIAIAKLFDEIFSPSPLIAARYLKKFYQDNTNEENISSFEDAVRDSIYAEIDQNKESNLFKEIRQLCVSPGRSPNLNSIITYNYDDILEKYLSTLEIEIPFKPIYSIGVNPATGELPIYHVHGFLPQDDDLDEKNKITLSEDIYHQQYSEIYSWNNIIQINKFRDNICLFIGVSLTDPNLRRLLDIAKSQKGDTDGQHYIFKKKYNLDVIESNLLKILSQNENLLSTEAMAELKFDETAKYLIKTIEKFEESDASSFGLSTIWVNDFSDIPKILEKIRKNET